jgi:hypothetical protein
LPIHSLLVHFDGALQSKMATSWNAARAATLYWRYVIELMSFSTDHRLLGRIGQAYNSDAQLIA